MTSRALTSSLLVALVLAGCRVQQPSTPVPDAPRVDSFSASATSLATPGQVALTWATANAERVTLTEVSTGDLGVAGDQLAGSLSVNVERSSIFVLTAHGPGGSDARAVAVNVAGAQPALTLIAVPAVIAGGGSTTLAWTAPGAQAVTLTAGTTPVDTRGQTTSGAVVVTPRRDTTYTLTDGSRTATTTVTVQLALLSVAANPPAGRSGEPLTLSWSTAGADRVTVSSPGRGQLTQVTAAAQVEEGNYVDTVPVLPANGVVTYEISAERGTERVTRTVTIFVGTGLAIARFDAPAVAAAGATYQVRWQTTAADRVAISVDGVRLYETPTLAIAANGGFAFTAPTDDFEVAIEATNRQGDRDTQAAQVDAVGVPSSATLMASPATVAVGGAVTLTYAAAEARRVRITDADGQTVFSVTGQAAESGTATVYPSASTTYTLSADNLLGNPAVTATAMVTVTGAATTVAQVPPTAISGQMVELVPSAAGATLYGFPHGQVLTSSVSNFVDISGTGERILEQGADVATVTLPFSTWLWGQQMTGPLTISRCGWIAWAGPLVVNCSETTLPSTSTSAAPGIIAPYWDTLTLTANSGVLVQLLGDAPEQRLVVQWNRMQASTTTGTELTFQVQVHQAGMVSFHYQTMNTNSSPSYTVGVQDPTRQVGYRASLAAPPTADSSLYFFSPLTTAPEVRLFKGMRWGGFVKNGTGYGLVTSPARAVQLPQDLTISELMFRPASAVPAGQYLEALNQTDSTWDLTGWFLRAGDGSSFAVPQGTTLAANGVLVLGASTDRAQNDDAGVDVEWGGSGFSLGFDAGSVNFGTADAGYGLVFTGPSDGGTGASVELDPGPFVFQGSATQGFESCWATQAFGSQAPSQLGSPGAAVGCGFPYRRQAIAPNFRDISATGTVLTAPAANELDSLFTVTLAPTPADPQPTLFGAPRPQVTVSLNGWIAPTVITGLTSTQNSGNKTSPNLTPPMGTIAPFWNDLEAIGGRSTLTWQKLEPNEDPTAPGRHWIFQWTRFSTDLGSSGPDDLTFQAKVFEDGTLEFHYRTMASGTSSNYGLGGSATVWVENPTATQAIVVSANQAAPRDNTAWRFSVR